MFGFNFNKKEKPKEEYILSGHLVDSDTGVSTNEFATHIPADSEAEAVRKLIQEYPEKGVEYNRFQGQVIKSNHPDLKIESKDLEP